MKTEVAPGAGLKTELGAMSPEELLHVLDAEVRRRLGISAQEMLTLCRQGKLEDADRVQDLLAAAGVLDERLAA